jgi:hypothetical protein
MLRFLVLGVSALLFTAPTAVSQEAPPYESLAKAALTRFGQPDANPDTFDLQEALTETSLHVRIGLYEVYMSRDSARDKTYADSLVQVIQSLVNAQEAWLAWLEPTHEFDQAQKDLKVLGKWAAKLRGSQLQRLAKDGEGELFAALHAKDSQREAAERFAQFMGSGAALGMDRPDSREPVVLGATRTEFLELLSLAGLLYPDLQSVYWQPGITSWTNFYVDQYKFIALEYASAGAGAHWAAGTAMDASAQDGLAQQVTQLAANSLIDNYFGDRIPPSLAGALSVNLTIDVFGTCDTRVDGDLKARRTEAFEMFVPGGASEGGWLPGKAADSRWREQQGADHFIAVLKASQSAGADEMKRSRGKLIHFQIENDGANKRMAISGPFLGAAAQAVEVPPEQYRGDYKEFLRSYRSCFVYWLREESLDGSASKSRAGFSEWLTNLATNEDLDIEDAIRQVFGAPLSEGSVTEDVLEGAFLTWLRKAKG